MTKAKNKEDITDQLSDLGHEFNNLLTTILANLRFVGQEELSFAARKHVDKAAEFTARAADLSHHLLALSQKQNLSGRVVEPNEIVKNLDVRLKLHLGFSRAIKIKPSLLRQKVFVDPLEFEKVLVALCMNSIEAMPKYGKINLNISSHTVDGRIADEKTFKKGDYVLIEISDNGIGMSKAALKKATKPLFTTKKVKGAGMGLTMVTKFIEKAGGHLRIYSELNKGTTVKMFLPRFRTASEEQARVAAKKVAKKLEGKGETILLVEDDINVLKVVAQSLKARNYKVLQAEEGRHAIDMIEAAEKIDLLVTDVFLVDEISGKEVAQQFEKSFPKAGVIYCSGYHDEVVRKKLSLAKDSKIISKPYEIRTLLMEVSQHLKAPKKKTKKKSPKKASGKK